MKHLKPYLKYKDLGVKWLGKIPAHWEATRFKYGIEIIESGKRDLVEHSDILSIGGEHIGTNYKLNLKNLKYLSEDFYHKNKKGRIQVGDILIVKDGATIGKTAYIDVYQLTQKMFLNEHVYRIVAHKYIYYFILSLFFQSKIWSENNSSAQEGLNLSTIKNIPILKPLKKEQQSIADFLDKETAQIDSLVRKKEKQIEFLKEKRLVLITQVVTKGLNPNVKMKDSGVKWLGRIPEHWKKDRIKYSTYVKGRIGWKGLRADEFIEEGPYLITGTDFQNGKINWDTCYHITNERYLEDPYIQLKENDLLITKDGSIGKIAMVRNLPSRASLNSGVFITRPIKNNYCNSFMYWILNSQIFNFFINYMSRGSTINHLYQNVFEMFSFPLPSKKEQRSIIKFLDKETSRIDSLIEKIENSIKLLKEYRQVLITSAVTGKIDVRESQKVKDNIIPLQISKREVHLLFKTAVLGAEIVAQMKDSPHFGRTKFMKTLYLCEVHLQMPLQGKYKREAAGPFDNKLYKIESIMKKQKWFKTVKIGPMYKYSSLQNSNGYRKYFNKYWNKYQFKLNNLLSFAKQWTTEQSEIIDTIFAVWNDLLIENKKPSVEEIIYEVKNNWYHTKKRFSDDRLKKAIKWMKENELVPQGYGLKTQFIAKGRK